MKSGKYIYIYIYIYIYVCVCAAQSLKMGGLESGPTQKKWGGGLSERPSLKTEGVLELKITKKRIFLKGSPGRKSGTNKCIFLKRGVFRCGPG